MKKKNQRRKIDSIKKRSTNRAHNIFKDIEIRLDELYVSNVNLYKLNEVEIVFHTSKNKTNIRINSKNSAVKIPSYRIVLHSNVFRPAVKCYIPKPPIKNPSTEKPTEAKPEKPTEEKK
jgi:hypothetical protein